MSTNTVPGISLYRNEGGDRGGYIGRLPYGRAESELL